MRSGNSFRGRYRQVTSSKKYQSYGGAVFVEDPKAAAVPSMPKTALDSKVAGAILLLNMLREVVMDQGYHLNEELKCRKNEE